MTRAERRRQERGVFPCLGCGRRLRLKYMNSGYCNKCSEKCRAMARKEGLPKPISAHLMSVRNE
jgi:hypothetical protein